MSKPQLAFVDGRLQTIDVEAYRNAKFGAEVEKAKPAPKPEPKPKAESKAKTEPKAADLV